jgi:hypothetical protein
MSGPRFSGITRWFLYLLIGSIGLGALLAIVIVLAGNWGWVETRILMTTGVVAAASVFGMACGAAMSRLGSKVVPLIGIGLAGVAAALLIAGMWAEFGGNTYWKVTASVSILAVAFAHISLLSLARLQSSLRWIQYVAYGLVFLFALTVVGMIVTETALDGVVRFLAVVGILDGAFSLLVPVVHFLNRRSGQPTDVAAIEAEIDRLRARIAELEAARIAAGADAGSTERATA